MQQDFDHPSGNPHKSVSDLQFTHCGGIMIRRFLVIALLAIGATVSHAQQSLPSSFQAKIIHSPEAADIFVRWGGKGPVVVLIHGYAQNSDSWAPLAADLVTDHTVVVPDLRGIGRSSKPDGGYDKKTQAKDIRAVVTGLGYDKTFVVAHDIGNMVAYAYAAIYPDKVERLVVMDAPIPGIDPWNEILLNPGVWHFNFHGPDAERLVAGRERIYFDRISGTALFYGVWKHWQRSADSYSLERPGSSAAISTALACVSPEAS